MIESKQKENRAGKMLNNSLPTGSRGVDGLVLVVERVGLNVKGGGQFGDSLASVRVLQSHPSSLFLWD